MNDKEFKEGDVIRFEADNLPFTVKACSHRYLICTRPIVLSDLKDWNECGYTKSELMKTVIYTIVDLDEQIRGPHDRVLSPYDYVQQQDIETCLEDIEKGEISISVRYRVPLDIRWQQ